MLTLVRFPPSIHRSRDAAALIAAYLAFDRKRTRRRPFVNGFGALAVVILAGAAIGRLAVQEAMVAAAVCIAPPAVFIGEELYESYRLQQRLDTARAEQRKS